MRSKVPSHGDTPQQEREQQIARFIRQYLDMAAHDGPQAVLLVARSDESPVARALKDAAVEIASRGIGVRMIVASAESAKELWPTTAGRHAREIRVARNPRLLDAHEQLVLGQRATWYGDSLRRDPLKRDAFESYMADDAAAAGRARSTFERLWQATEPLHVRQLGAEPAAA
jgi:hypothetical protein